GPEGHAEHAIPRSTGDLDRRERPAALVPVADRRGRHRDRCTRWLVFFHTVTLSLLELMPDPQIHRYRFRAGIRHDVDQSRMGEVGIYFAHAKLVGPKGAANSFLALSFTDGPYSLSVVKDPNGKVGLRAGAILPDLSRMNAAWGLGHDSSC